MGILIANIGNNSSCEVSIKRAGDSFERFISYDQETNIVTFSHIPDGFDYDYIFTLTCEGIIVFQEVFDFSCNLYYQIVRCFDGVIFWTNIPFIENNQVYYSGTFYYYYNSIKQRFNIDPENYIPDLYLHQGEYIECNQAAEFSYEFSLDFTS